MNVKKTEKKQDFSFILFFLAYFFYYSGYAVFSSFLVMFLTEEGLPATVCGIIASLTLVVNLAMEPVAGYLTDTWLSIRRFLMLCIVLLSLLLLLAHGSAGHILPLLVLVVVSAGIAYPFSQLLDAWAEICREDDPSLVYSRIREGGSIGFALTSIMAGALFRLYGFSCYFLLQLILFLLMLPFLFLLPDIAPTNRREICRQGSISFSGAFALLLHKPEYMFWLVVCTLYWMTHRPIGSFLSLIVTARGGSAGTYGNICGFGVAVEFLFLLLLGKSWDRIQRKKQAVYMLWGVLLLNLLRPACILLLPGLLPLYVLCSLPFRQRGVLCPGSERTASWLQHFSRTGGQFCVRDGVRESAGRKALRQIFRSFAADT